MKITQEPKFQPITLTLETKEEAEALYQVVRRDGIKCPISQAQGEFLRRLSDWFSERAQL